MRFFSRLKEGRSSSAPHMTRSFSNSLEAEPLSAMISSPGRSATIDVEHGLEHFAFVEFRVRPRPQDRHPEPTEADVEVADVLSDDVDPEERRALVEGV